MSFGHEIRNLVERTHNEIDKLHLHDRPQAEIAHTAGRADDGASLIGVSITRSQPKRANNPSLS